MQNLNDMVTFARVVEASSFTAAAQRIGASKSRVSKTIARLESALGVRLLNRSTRGLSLTEIGAAFYEHCVRIADEATQASELVSQLQSEPRGVLRVTSSVAFGRLHIAPAAADFLGLYPRVRLEMTVTDRVVDLVSEGFDVAIRINSEPSPHHVARRLAPMRRVFCATPGYLERWGTPGSPQDLATHNCLHYTQSGSQGEWRLRNGADEIVVPLSGSFRVNDYDVLAGAVVSGLGIALLPTFIIGHELQVGRLRSVLTNYVPLERHVFACHLPNVHLPVKVRSFIDFLQARFGAVPYWDRDDDCPPTAASTSSQLPVGIAHQMAKL